MLGIFGTQIMSKLQIVGGLLWITVSVTLIIILWRSHPNDSIPKKVLWTIILVIPLAGWLFYGGMYRSLNPGPSKSGDGDSGWGAQTGGP